MTMQFLFASKNKDKLLETLENEFRNWYRNNNMIVNPDKFQLMLLQKSTKKLIQEKKSKLITTN